MRPETPSCRELFRSKRERAAASQLRSSQENRYGRNLAMPEGDAGMNRTTRPGKTYHSRSCNLHLCYGVAQGFYLVDPHDYIEEVGEPRFRCERCGRQAQRPGRLCLPHPLADDPP